MRDLEIDELGRGDCRPGDTDLGHQVQQCPLAGSPPIQASGRDVVEVAGKQREHQDELEYERRDIHCVDGGVAY